MLLAQIAMMLFAGLPPSNPQLPLVILKTSISATSNTEILHTVTLVGPPQAIGYSSWLGNFLSFNGILTTAAPPPGSGCAGSGAGSFPCTPRHNYAH